MGNVENFWEEEEQGEEQEFDSFLDDPEDFDEEEQEDFDEEQEDENGVEAEGKSGRINGIDLNALCTKFLSFRKPEEYQDADTKIETNMYQYMIDNYDKVMFWITSLAKTPTCRRKFEVLSENTHMDAEDLIQETYMRILTTFKNNEDRLKVCQNCTHQCKEFLNKTKRTNTEKYVEGYECRPYMFYSYSEKELHNYVNHSVKQNIDIKLKKLTTKTGERICVKLEETVSGAEDTCELGALLADAFGTDSESIKELIENLLSKKIVFINKLAKFDLTPDIFESKECTLHCINDKYNEATEFQKERKREVYERYGLEVPEQLKATPKMLKYVNHAKAMKELNSKFNMIPSYWQPEKFWNKLLKKAENEDYLKIGTKLTDQVKRDLLKHYNIILKRPKLNQVLPDEHIKKVQIAQGEDPELVEEAAMQAELDMLEFLPSSEDLKMYYENDRDTYYKYVNYLKGWGFSEGSNHIPDEAEDNPEMRYSEKTTEIKIVDADYKVIPLPLCTYAEVSVADFLGLCSDVKQGYEFFNKIFSSSDHITSFKEYWVSFDNRKYSINENIEYTLSKSKRKEIYKLEKLARRMNGKNLDPVFKEVQELIIKNQSIVDQFTLPFINKVCNCIKQTAIEQGFAKYIVATKRMFPIKRKKKISPEERRERARQEVARILSVQQRIQNNQIHDINTASEDTTFSNLNAQKLFDSILKRIPAQEMQFVMEEVKVLCTNQSDNLKNVLSV